MTNGGRGRIGSNWGPWHATSITVDATAIAPKVDCVHLPSQVVHGGVRAVSCGGRWQVACSRGHPARRTLSSIHIAQTARIALGTTRFLLFTLPLAAISFGALQALGRMFLFLASALLFSTLPTRGRLSELVMG